MATVDVAPQYHRSLQSGRAKVWCSSEQSGLLQACRHSKACIANHHSTIRPRRNPGKKGPWA